MKIEKIMIIADDSRSSIKAVQYGFSLARDVGAKVMLVSVIEPESVAGNPDSGVFPDDALIAAKAQTADFLERMEKSYAGSIATELLAPVGDSLPEIVKNIVDCGASLVVAGAHGRAGLSKLFGGSLAESLIHHSPVPVCVVPGG